MRLPSDSSAVDAEFARRFLRSASQAAVAVYVTAVLDALTQQAAWQRGQRLGGPGLRLPRTRAAPQAVAVRLTCSCPSQAAVGLGGLAIT